MIDTNTPIHDPYQPQQQTQLQHRQSLPSHNPLHTQQQIHPQPSLQASAQQQQQQIHMQQQQQHQQQQQQAQYMMNGANGPNMAAAGIMAPTPAGHQAELNYIYGMVEELSRQLADNRKVTEDIVSNLGRVRSRAKTQGLSNQDVIESAAGEINGTFAPPHLPKWLGALDEERNSRLIVGRQNAGQEENLEALISVLSESLEKAKFSRDANANLLSQYANALATMLKQFHEYKSKHVTDVASWHRSYRDQLAEARAENSHLRDQIWEMQAHAGRANESLREFRRCYDEDEARWSRKADDTAMRQELRFWKRMAMPELEENDPCWTDDDDIIDPAEKARLHERAAQEMMTDSQAEDSDDQQPQLPPRDMMGGIAMEREGSMPQAAPAPPPPRPLSAASSTGSTG